MKIKRHLKRSERGSQLTPQQEADSAQALLYIHELVEGGYATVQGQINPEECHRVLAEWKSKGIEPIEERAIRLSQALSIELGVFPTAKEPA